MKVHRWVGKQRDRNLTTQRGLKAGDGVDFTVLAYPNQIFNGTVTQVRINPTTVNNVVTYDVVVDVNNASGKLLPGMTANATINVASAQNALVVPLTAVHAQAASGASAGSPWGGPAGGSSARYTVATIVTLFEQPP